MRRYLAALLALLLAVAAAGLWRAWPAAGEAPPGPLEPLSPSPSPTPEAEAQPSPAAAAQEPEALAGVWVPYLSLETDEKTPEAFRENFRQIAQAAKERGLNALFVHVRPFCDALYPSPLYPWSHLLTGEQGRDPGFDPLEFMVGEAHRQGLAFHAWINPLRVKTAQTPAALSPDSPYEALKEDCPYYFMEWEGAVYLNPAWPYVRELIAQGAGEIVERYPVDGVHFDDYFYPSQDPSLDQAAYELYAAGVADPLPLADWRRANISAMVSQVYQAVKAADPDCAFGVSPQGNLDNDWAMGADVAAWSAIPGYVDYLCPQLYYSFENPALGYEEALRRWAALPRHDGLALYAGLALYKVGTDADQGTWSLTGEMILRQEEAAKAAACAGVVLYSADYLDRLGATG